MPGHLRHGFGKIHEPSRFRKGFDRTLDRFRDGPFRRLVELAYDWRYTTVAFTVAMLIVSIGLLAGGRVGFRFFPSPEPENIMAYVEFGAGTPQKEQAAGMRRISNALKSAEKNLTGGAEKLVVTAFITLGQSGRSRGDNLAQIEVQLTASEERTTPTKKIVRAWRKALPSIPGVERVALLGRRGGPPGRDVDVQLQDAPVENLKAAAGGIGPSPHRISRGHRYCRRSTLRQARANHGNHAQGHCTRVHQR